MSTNGGIMESNNIKFEEFASRYFNGEEFLFMYKNLSLHFKIIDSANVLEYSDGQKIKYMPLKSIDHLYHITMNSISILDFWNDFIYVKNK